MFKILRVNFLKTREFGMAHFCLKVAIFLFNNRMAYIQCMFQKRFEFFAHGPNSSTLFCGQLEIFTTDDKD